ncbi:sodium/potassium/calcium exchanger 3-like isoform X1 [Arapaima gigas]
MKAAPGRGRRRRFGWLCCGALGLAGLTWILRGGGTRLAGSPGEDSRSGWSMRRLVQERAENHTSDLPPTAVARGGLGSVAAVQLCQSGISTSIFRTAGIKTASRGSSRTPVRISIAKVSSGYPVCTNPPPPPLRLSTSTGPVTAHGDGLHGNGCVRLERSGLFVKPRLEAVLGAGVRKALGGTRCSSHSAPSPCLRVTCWDRRGCQQTNKRSSPVGELVATEETVAIPVRSDGPRALASLSRHPGPLRCLSEDEGWQREESEDGWGGRDAEPGGDMKNWAHMSAPACLMSVTRVKN